MQLKLDRLLRGYVILLLCAEYVFFVGKIYISKVTMLLTKASTFNSLAGSHNYCSLGVLYTSAYDR